MYKLILLLILAPHLTFAQQLSENGRPINELDGNNHKTGFWKLTDPNRGISVSGMADGDTRLSDANYFEAGKLVMSQPNDSTLIFYENSRRIHARFVDKRLVAEDGTELHAKYRDTYFRVSEIRPMFYGGQQALIKYLERDLKKIAAKHQGRVVVKFTINANGFVEKPTVISTNNENLREQATNLIKNLPRWQPGLQGGRFVRAQLSLPIIF